MQVRTLRGGGRWDEVEPAWTALQAASPPVAHVQRAEWVRALCDHHQGDDARWLLAEDADGWVAALPLRASPRRLGPLRLRMLVNDRLSDGQIAARASSDELVRGLLAGCAAAGEPVDLVSLNGLRPGTAFIRLAAASAGGLETEVHHGGHSVIDTRRTSEDWQAGMGRNLRASLRKAGNRAARRGEVTVTVATAPDDVARAFDEFVAIEASGWKAGVGALATDATDRALLRQFLVDAAARGGTAVRTLRVDDRPAAAQLTDRTGATLSLLKVAYDDELADLSPSNLLMADLVRTCCDAPDVERIDLITNQPWHDRWHADEMPTYKARITNRRRPGGIAGAGVARLAAAGVRLPRA